jgi:hypothetical protein
VRVSLFTRVSKWANMSTIHLWRSMLKETFPSHRYLKER